MIIPLRFLVKTEEAFYGCRPLRSSRSGVFLPRKHTHVGYTEHIFLNITNIYVLIFSPLPASESITYGTPACVWVSRAKISIV